LISFEQPAAASNLPQHQGQPQPVQHLVQISQVVTETSLVERSSHLENALSSCQFAEFCAMKIANSTDETEENIWNFMKVCVWCVIGL